jgi:CRP-like cAMP-binding protein
MASDNRGTVKLPREQYDHHNERRDDMGLSWSDYINGEAPQIAETVRRIVREELDELDGREQTTTEKPNEDRQDSGTTSEERIRSIISEELEPVQTKLKDIETAIENANRGY